MGIIQRAGDLVYSFRFITLLVTPFQKTKAFELGIIDENGKRNKDVKLDTSERKSAYTSFHRLVFNIKKIMAKAPGGSSTLASYAAALYLIREKLELTDKSIHRIVEKTGFSPVDFLNESNQWFVLEDKMLTPGMYILKNDKMVNKTCEEVAYAKDAIKVLEKSYPVGDIFGLDVYEALHIKTNQKLYITVGELIK
jgi:hypothetical protein